MRRKMLAPINSVKHYVHHPEALIAVGGILNQNAVEAAQAPAVANPWTVKEGSIVKAIYIERWLIGDSAGAVSQFNLTVEKKRSGEPDMTFAQSANLGAYPNKKNILYTTQGIVPSIVGGPTVPVIRQYILIPKGKQRMGLNDEIMVNISAVAALRQCGIETFKEYT